MRLGVVTCAKCPNLTVSEQKLIPLLEAHGVMAIPVVWNDPVTNWSTFDCLLIRSIWDYHLHPEAFVAWLHSLEAHGTKTWNPIPILLRNYHKFYLRDLEERGVRIVPTLFQKDSTDAFDRILSRGWKKGVAKPAISASGFRTETFSVSSQGQAKRAIQNAHAQGDFLIQEFMPAIQEAGELSLIYFNHVYSHAVLKRPRPGEFRVQAEYGGDALPCQPDEHIIQTAAKILAHFGNELLYARVDGIVIDGEFVLMELELIEPDLFLDSHPGTHTRFVESLVSRLRTSSH